MQRRILVIGLMVAVAIGASAISPHNNNPVSEEAVEVAFVRQAEKSAVTPRASYRFRFEEGVWSSQSILMMRTDRSKAERIRDFVSGNFFHAVRGDGHVFSLSHFNSGDSKITDDEFGYRFWTEVKDLTDEHVYTLDGDGAHLVYYHFGPYAPRCIYSQPRGTVRARQVSVLQVVVEFDLKFSQSECALLGLGEAVGEPDGVRVTGLASARRQIADLFPARMFTMRF